MRLNRLPAAGCAAVGLALCAGTPGPAVAATSSAPVIHESFTLLPCPSKPATTVQIEGCAEHRVITLDRGIDQLNAKVYVKLDRAARLTFVRANREWVLYRNDTCTAQASIYKGGSVQPVAYADCLVSIDSSHVAELKAMLTALEPAG